MTDESGETKIVLYSKDFNHIYFLHSNANALFKVTHIIPPSIFVTLKSGNFYSLSHDNTLRVFSQSEKLYQIALPQGLKPKKLVFTDQAETGFVVCEGDTVLRLIAFGG